MRKLSFIKILLVATTVTGMLSCKKAFDLKPGTELAATQFYRNVYDADAAVLGIYGKFMKLSDRYIILNELRADLLDFTENADENLRQVSEHTVNQANPYADPRPFYELILNCNDVLKNFTIMKQNNTLKEGEFNQRYSDIACLRSFLYLQLGIHYGDVPYITEPLETVDAIKDQSRFAKIPFAALLDSLVTFTEAIPFKDEYPGGTSLNITLDAYPTQRFFINKKCMLGDLNLWKGNYRQAASYYRQVMETATTGNPGEAYYSQYKIGWWGTTNATSLYVQYSRGGDASTLLYSEGWRTMFEASDDRFNREWIWALPYDNKFQPENPLIKLFSPIGGNYLVKPSQAIMDNWDSQQQNNVAISSSINGLPYDARALLSTRVLGGKLTAMKFLYNYINQATNTPTNPLLKNGRWFLYRQTHLHLRFAEAANREGFPRLALSLLNNGITAGFAPPANTPDVTNFQNTLSYPAPYNFDGRNGEIPRFRADWYRNLGIRGRANVKNLVVTSASDSLLQIEDGLINEGALENAFEGTRWADLLRVAIRRNDPAFIADKVYSKLIKSGVSAGAAAQARTKLMNRDWYLPFKL